jgi:hypothetical protein
MYLTIKFPTALITVLGENLRASVEAVITKVAPTRFILRMSFTSKTMDRWLTRRYASGAESRTKWHMGWEGKEEVGGGWRTTRSDIKSKQVPARSSSVDDISPILKQVMERHIA